MPAERGVTLVEWLVVVVVAALLAGAALPALGRMRGAALAAAGARHLAISCQALRWRSVAEGRAHGMLFRPSAEGWSWSVVRDDNGNGLRAADVASGADVTISGPHRLSDVVPGIHLGFPPLASIPELPPSTGWIDDTADPVRFGKSDLVAFGARGTSSSGTLFVGDRRERLYAIVIYGPTARIRIWRYVASEQRWVT